MKTLQTCLLLMFLFFLIPTPTLAIYISNNMSSDEVGYWAVDILTGGESRNALLTANRFASGDIYTENVLYDYFSYVDVGANGGAVRLSDTNIASIPVLDPLNPNVASSTGFFTGENNRIIDWTATSSIVEGTPGIMTTRFTFTTRDGGGLGTLRFLQYLDEDVEGVGDDVLFVEGTAGSNNLELFTFDSVQVYGVSQSGVFLQGSGLEQATFKGWAADVFDAMRPRITGAGQPLSESGVINNLPSFSHPQIGQVYGPRDVVSVLAWDVDQNASTAVITTSLGGRPDLTSAFRPPPVDPPGEREIIGNIDPSRPTIVLTHGLQGGLDDDEQPNLNKLWTSFSDNSNAYGAGYLLDQYDQLNAIGGGLDDYNIIQFVWREAYQGLLGYTKARPYADDAGVALASQLTRDLGVLYNKPIQFIGHSLGTVVNAYAARLFLTAAQNIHISQFTILDYPNKWRYPFVDPPNGLIPENFFATLLQDFREGSRGLRMDNYYSEDTKAHGNNTDGPIYDHQRLVNPQDVGDFFTDESGSIAHTGVHQWYRWTIFPQNPYESSFQSQNTVCNGTEFAPGKKPWGFDSSLNPCAAGWAYSLFGSRRNTFPPVGNPITVTALALPLGEARSFGCTTEASSTGTIIRCEEQSSPFIVFEVDIPSTADYVSFEYNFVDVGDGDYVAVYLDDTPIWILAGSSVVQSGVFFDSGPIPLSGFTGNRRLTIALYGVNDPNALFEIRNFRVFNAPSFTEGDPSGDGTVNAVDQRILVAAFGSCSGNARYNPDVDYDHDGCITFVDYQMWYQLYKNQ